MPDKLTDSEIVKALGSYKADIGCAKCGFKDKYLLTVIDSALDLINRQNVEIDDLESIVGLRNKRKYYRKFVDEVYRKEKGKELSDPDFDYIYELYFKLQAENERLKNAYKQCAWERDIFAEDMKEEIKKDCSYLMLDIKTIKAEAYKECIEKVNNKIRFLENRGFSIHYVVKDALNNLLKEMVGEDNAEEKE